MNQRDDFEQHSDNEPGRGNFGDPNGGFHTPPWGSVEPSSQSRSPIPLRPLDVLETLSGSLQIMRYNIPVMVGIPLVVQLTISVMSFLFMDTDGSTGVEISTQGQLTTANIDPASFASSVISLIVALILTATATVGALNALYGRRISVGRALGEAFADAPRLLLAMALYILMGAALATVLLFVLNLLPPGVFVTPVVLLVLVVLVFYFSIRLSCVVPVLVAENAGPIEAIKRSLELTRGNFGLVAGPLVLTALIFFIATLVISPIFLMAGHTAAVLGSAVVSAFAAAYFNALSALIYINLRMHDEGFHRQVTNYLD